MEKIIGMRIEEGRMEIERYNILKKWKKEGRQKIKIENIMEMERGIRLEEN